MPIDAHAARARLGRRDVGDVGLRDGDVGGGDAAPDARDEEPDQRLREAEHRHARPPRRRCSRAAPAAGPTRSESRPHIGMNRNCMSEKAAPGSVATKSLAPRSAREPGRNGITSPKPSRSRNTVRNSVPSEALREPVPGAVAGAAAVIALDRDRGRRGSSPRGARAATRRRSRAVSAARREVVLPVDDADGRAGAAGAAREKGLHGGGILAHPLDQHGDVRRLAGAGRRGRRTRAGSRRAAGAARRSRARAADRPACGQKSCAVQGIASRRRRRPLRSAPSASVWNSGSMRSRVIAANRW